MANVDADSDIDWMVCELIEKLSGKVSGKPIVRGTRILPDAIVDSYDLGETIDENLDRALQISPRLSRRVLRERGHTVWSGAAIN